MLRIANKVIVSFMMMLILVGCFGQSNEKAYLHILDKEKRSVEHYSKKGYIAYLQDMKAQLPKKIAEKNRYVTAINTAYLQMDRQQKDEYIDTWRNEFTESWKGYEQAFLNLKTNFNPTNDLEKAEAQRLEMEWQAVMQENKVVSLEAPLFFVMGD